MIDRFPLTWAQGQSRIPASARKNSRFDTPLKRAVDDLLSELELLGAREIIISSNLELKPNGLPYADSRQPSDPAVAVYFNRKTSDGAPRPFVIACDTYRLVADNVRAVGMTVAALRTIQRHGASSMLEQAFTGFAALPPAFREKPWWEVLGVTERATPGEVKDAWLKLVQIHHPDRGGSTERMAEINAAYQRSKEAT